jgi:O-antigen/teichoic acid export membrane protein
MLPRLNKSTIGEGAWVVVGQGANGILSLAGTRLVTQFVGPELFGAINLAQNALILLRTLFCYAILRAGLRYYPNAEIGGYVPALRGFLVRSLARAMVPIELIAIGGGLIWSVRRGTSPSIAVILAVFVIADVLQAFETTTLNAARRQRESAIFNIVASLAKPLLMVGGILIFGATIEVALAGITTGVFVALVVLYANKGLTETGHASVLPAGVARDMWRFAVPLIPIALLNWTSSVSD